MYFACRHLSVHVLRVTRYTFSNKCTINIVYDTLKKQSSLGAHKCPDGKCDDYDQKGLYPLYPLAKKEDIPRVRFV